MPKKSTVVILLIFIFTGNIFSQTASPLEIDSTGTVNVDKKLKHTNGNTYDPLPVGTILMYSGIDWVDNKIPGWKACTAANNQVDANIPNLEGTFIMGTSTTAISNVSVSRTGGKNELAASDLPKHSHTINHDHPAASESSAHSHGYSDIAYNENFSSGVSSAAATNGWHKSSTMNPSGLGSSATDRDNQSIYRNTTTGGKTVTIDLPMTSGMSSGTVGTNTKMDNRPKYYTVIYIIKVSN